MESRNAPAALPRQMEKPQAHRRLGISSHLAQEMGRTGAGACQTNPLQFPEVLSLFSHLFDPLPFFLNHYLSFPGVHWLPLPTASLFNRGSFRTLIFPIAQQLLPEWLKKQLLPCSKPKPLTERQKGEPERILAHQLFGSPLKRIV